MQQPAYENDPTQGSAKSISNGLTQPRSKHEAGDVGWAKFTIGSGDTEMRLYSAGTRLAFNDDSGPGLFSRIMRNTLPAGTYYLQIREKATTAPFRRINFLQSGLRNRVCEREAGLGRTDPAACFPHYGNVPNCGGLVYSGMRRESPRAERYRFCSRGEAWGYD